MPKALEPTLHGDDRKEGVGYRGWDGTEGVITWGQPLSTAQEVL